MAKMYDVCDIIRVLFLEATGKCSQEFAKSQLTPRYRPAAFSPMLEPTKPGKASTPKWDPIIMFMAIVDELVELLSIDCWNVFLGYFESRQDELTGVSYRSGAGQVITNGLVFKEPTSVRRASAILPEASE